jgi:Icc-related predicted phosphoesterase
MSVRSLFGQRRSSRGPRILFATDIHGSDRCFRKFLNAAPLFGVDYLILGGDITGKMLVPVVESPPGEFACRYGDELFEGLDRAGVDELIKRIHGFGAYTIVVDKDEADSLQAAEHRGQVFEAVVGKAVEDWVTLAEERLRGTGVRCFMAPGNDDFLSIDDSLQGSDVVEFAENSVLRLDDVHEMITTGYSNPTPWDTERELSEELLRERIEGMAVGVQDPSNLIAVLHPPPYRSGLDDAPMLSDDLSMTLTADGVTMGPVGSTAVRDFVEETQPLLALHGHVHEGRGAVTVGRTLCINPGSEYTEGVLSASLIELGDGRVVSHQFVSG